MISSGRWAGTPTEGVDEGVHHAVAQGPVALAVGGDHALVDPPGRLDLDVRVAREYLVEPAGWLSVSRSMPVCTVRRAE